MQEFRTAGYDQPIMVTVTDPETGEVLGQKVVKDDYVLIVVGRRYLKSMQVWGRTHQLNVAYDTTPNPQHPCTDGAPDDTEVE